jgi:predicted nucleic acid-binding protein
MNKSEIATLYEVVVDTSVWISRILEDDSNHQAAKAWTDSYLLNGGILIAPALFVTEIAAAISRQTRQPSYARAIIAQLHGMFNLQLVAIDEELIDGATEIATDLGLRGADALFVALAARLNVPLVSFDNEQLLKSVALIETIRP